MLVSGSCHVIKKVPQGCSDRAECVGKKSSKSLNSLSYLMLERLMTKKSVLRLDTNININNKNIFVASSFGPNDLKSGWAINSALSVRVKLQYCPLDCRANRYTFRYTWTLKNNNKKLGKGLMSLFDL